MRQHSTTNLCTQQPIAILGNGDAGKSTLVSTLVYGELDNGRGRSRLHLFRHPHEISSGKTSCISIDFLGFDQLGNVLQPSKYRDKDELLLDASKIVEFWDLAGDQRYMKTTAYGEGIIDFYELCSYSLWLEKRIYSILRMIRTKTDLIITQLLYYNYISKQGHPRHD